MGIRQLFENKITSVSARVFLAGLNMERAMFQKMVLSKRLIEQNKWKPRVGEKVRLVEVKYKQPCRSFPATIRKIMNNQICVCYDGWGDDASEWLAREEWVERITILESTLSYTHPNESDLKQSGDSEGKVAFEVGQKLQGHDGGWYDAIIKEVGYNKYNKRYVRIGWLLDKWASERYDKIYSEDKWAKKLRD
eukprot:354516_1